jgi:hypothetical protein
MSEELTRIDSAVAGLSISPKDEKVEKVEKKTHKRVTSTADGVRNVNDLGKNSLSCLKVQRLPSLKLAAEKLQKRREFHCK